MFTCCFPNVQLTALYPQFLLCTSAREQDSLFHPAFQLAAVLFSLLLLLSAVQLFVSFGLLNYFFPLLLLLRPLFPIAHPHLPQIIPHIVFASYSWLSFRSCCVRFPFVYGLSHCFISHSFYMPQQAQSFVFMYLTVFLLLID